MGLPYRVCCKMSDYNGLPLDSSRGFVTRVDRGENLVAFVETNALRKQFFSCYLNLIFDRPIFPSLKPARLI